MASPELIRPAAAAIENVRLSISGKSPLFDLAKRRRAQVDPDASNDSIKDSGALAKGVRVAETVDGAVSNLGSAASLVSRIPAAPAMFGRFAGLSSRAAPVMAALQAVDGVRLLSPTYRAAAAGSLQNMQDAPSMLDSKYFNASASMQALGRAPSTIYALGAAAAGTPNEGSANSPYNAERARRLRDVPLRRLTATPTLGATTAARNLFRQP